MSQNDPKDKISQEFMLAPEEEIDFNEYEEIESEIITLELSKTHEKGKLNSKQQEKFLEKLVKSSQIEIQGLFTDNTTIKFANELEFGLNYDSHAGTVLYFGEREGEIIEEENGVDVQKFEYMGPAIRKVVFQIDPSEQKMQEILGINAQEVKKPMEEEKEQRLDSIYTIKEKRDFENGVDEDGEEEIFMEDDGEEEKQKNGKLLGRHTKLLSNKDIKDLLLEDHNKLKSGKRSAIKTSQPNLIRKKVISENLKQKKTEDFVD